MHGNMELIKFLIEEQDVKTNTANKNGDNVLMIAVRQKNLELVKYLCET